MSIEIACVIMGLLGWVLGIYCGSKLNLKEKPKFTPMRFTKEKQKVLIVKSCIRRKSEEMNDIRISIQRQLKDGLVLLPCDLEYSFGEVTIDKVIYGEAENSSNQGE